MNRLGKGTVVTFACSPDFATAGEYHIVEARKLFRNAVRFLEPAPRMGDRAPANVETVVTDDPAARTLRVHFIAYNSPPQTTSQSDRPHVLPGLIEDAPLFRAAITVRDGVKTAAALNPKTQLKSDGNRVEVTVEDIHEVVIVRY